MWLRSLSRWNGAVAPQALQRNSRPLPMSGLGILWCGRTCRTALLVRQGMRPMSTTPSRETKTTPLPDGVTDFAAMREGHYRYVDKTAHIAGIVPPQVSRRRAYLCRPEGFGKTLFLSTLRYYFEGRADLFEGLQAQPPAEARPVLCLDMGEMGSTKSELETKLSKWMEEQVDLIDAAKWKGCSFVDRLSRLLETKEGVVVLIDNYETPLVQSVGTPEENGVRELYSSFFPQLEYHDNLLFLLAVGTLERRHIDSELLHYCFNLSGVSSFPEWAEVCGFSMPEIRETFEDRIDAVWSEGTRRVLKEFKRHYVGFDFHKRNPQPCDPLRLLYRPNDVLRMLGVQTSSPEFWIQATPPAEKSLPDSGTADFALLRRANLVYVDKTSFISKLVPDTENSSADKKNDSDKGELRQYLLCRPRGFGKSLFCSMLRYYFEGRKDLFKGLDISKRKKTLWTARPVLHFDLSFQYDPDAESLRRRISDTLSKYEKVYGCGEEKEDLNLRLKHLTTAIFKRTVFAPVILIDELDSAFLTVTDETSDSVRKVYSAFVASFDRRPSEHHFVLVTGTTNFVELEHICNISLDAKFAGVCGFTKEELEWNYKVRIERMAEKLKTSIDSTVELLLKMYSGYRFSSSELTVMHPCAAVEAVETGELNPYWANTLWSSLLRKVMETDVVMSAVDARMLLESPVRCREFDLHWGTLYRRYRTFEAWLFFLGYLTISQALGNDNLELCYPNEEVKNAVRECLLLSSSGTLLVKDRMKATNVSHRAQIAPDVVHSPSADAKRMLMDFCPSVNADKGQRKRVTRKTGKYDASKKAKKRVKKAVTIQRAKKKK